MKKAILIIHGPLTELKRLVMKDLRNFFEDYAYFREPFVYEKIGSIRRMKKNVLIEVTDVDLIPGIQGVNVFINCPKDKIITANDHDSFVFDEEFDPENEKQSSIIAGSIIVHQKNWCQSNGLFLQ